MRDLRNLQGLTTSYASCLPCLIVTQIGPNDKLRRDMPEFFRDREGRLPHMRQPGIETMPPAAAVVSPHLADPASDLSRLKIMQK